MELKCYFPTIPSAWDMWSVVTQQCEEDTQCREESTNVEMIQTFGFKMLPALLGSPLLDHSKHIIEAYYHKASPKQ